MERAFSQGDHIAKFTQGKQFRLQPRFTLIHHPVREKFDLSLSSYAVIDSIHQLSHRPDYPWRSTPKEKLAQFLSFSRKTVHNAINDGLGKGLLEKNDRGDLRTTTTWMEQVVLYNSKAG